jgi:hypothetical protein
MMKFKKTIHVTTTMITQHNQKMKFSAGSRYKAELMILKSPVDIFKVLAMLPQKSPIFSYSTPG